MTTELSIAEHFGRLAQFGGRCLVVQRRFDETMPLLNARTDNHLRRKWAIIYPKCVVVILGVCLRNNVLNDNRLY